MSNILLHTLCTNYTKNSKEVGNSNRVPSPCQRSGLRLLRIIVWLFDTRARGDRAAVSLRCSEIRAKKYARACRGTRLSKLSYLGKYPSVKPALVHRLVPSCGTRFEFTDIYEPSK